MIQRRLLRGAARLAARLRVGGAAYRLLGFVRRMRRPSVIRQNRRLRKSGAPDGLPLPPDHLLHLVVGGANLGSFLRGGEAAAHSIRDILLGAGRTIESFDAVLDFGCGCGRVLRHWQGVAGPRFHGCDYNPELVRWTAENVPFVAAETNGAMPPLPYAAGSFDLVYALSVFTHMTERGQQAWLAELRKVLRPGGLLMLTVHGHHFAHLMTPEERARFGSGELVVTNPELEGTNVCAAFHPPEYVRARMADGFEVLAHQPQGARGHGGQDQYLFRRRS